VRVAAGDDPSYCKYAESKMSNIVDIFSNAYWCLHAFFDKSFKSFEEQYVHTLYDADVVELGKSLSTVFLII
jgi:hypothetical protein